MRFPSVFVNHGGGPAMLMGRQECLEQLPQLLPMMYQQERLSQHLRELPKKWLESYGTEPSAIVVISAHWENNPIRITAHPHPPMYYDYDGFAPQHYQYQYPAPGSPPLAQRIQSLLQEHDIPSVLDKKRGFDHGVFVPLMLMYPKADIPVVMVSLHSSLAADIHLRMGQALEPLRDDNILILGSGYSFHNGRAFFHPTQQTHTAAKNFNDWVKETLLTAVGANSTTGEVDCSIEMDNNINTKTTTNNKKNGVIHELWGKLAQWETAPGARIAHPREEHLLPLLVTAAAGGHSAKTRLIYDVVPTVDATDAPDYPEHALSGYLFV